LEFHGIRTGMDRGIDHMPGNLQIPIMIDSDLRNDVSGAAITDYTIP
jgi:hypothetical protein